MGNARKTVLRLLTRLENSGSYSNILLDEGLERSDLSPQDKKFAAALFYGVLERQITLDNIIREYSRNPKNKLGTEVRVILRMGLYQLLYMDSVPDNAAVDESVKLAKKNRNPKGVYKKRQKVSKGQKCHGGAFYRILRTCMADGEVDKGIW